MMKILSTAFHPRLGTAMSSFLRLARIVRRRPIQPQPAACPWQWERLATPQEIADLWTAA